MRRSARARRSRRAIFGAGDRTRQHHPLVHYCQACDEPRLMEPEGSVIRCGHCENTVPMAPVQPVFLVSGASGAGKSTILPELVAVLRGECIVFDGDWLIDPFVGQPSVEDIHSIHWPSVQEAMLHIAHGLSQNGLPTLLLGSFMPQTLHTNRARRWVGDAHFLVLDCPDNERRLRLEARPPWRGRDIDAQLGFALWLRTNLSPVIDTSTTTPRGVAEQVATWVRSHLEHR